jgi:hypothetical protein
MTGTFDGAGIQAAITTLVSANLPVLLAVAIGGLAIWGGFFALDLSKKAAKKGAK